MKEEEKRRKVVAFKPDTTMTEHRKLYTTTWLDEDGKVHPTVHDGSFSPSPSPPGPTPYTPDPWLKLTSEQDGSQVSFVFASENEPSLQMSTDGDTWTPLSCTEVEDHAYLSDTITLDVGEIAYVKSNNNDKPVLTVIQSSGSVYMDGNAYALISNDNNDWDVLSPIFFANVTTQDDYGATHLPDLPASVLPEGLSYDNIFQIDSETWIFTATSCPVTDDGETFNFYIGVTPQDLYDAGVIARAGNPFMAIYLGNHTGFDIIAVNTLKKIIQAGAPTLINADISNSYTSNGDLWIIDHGGHLEYKLLFSNAQGDDNFITPTASHMYYSQDDSFDNPVNLTVNEPYTLMVDHSIVYLDETGMDNGGGES